MSADGGANPRFASRDWKIDDAEARPGKTVILNMTPDSKTAFIGKGFYPNHPYPALNGLNPFAAVSVVAGDAQRAFPDFPRYERSIGDAIETVATQVVRDRLDDIGGARPGETQRPVDMDSHSSATFAVARLGRNLNDSRVRWMAVDRFRLHRKVLLSVSIFCAIREVVDSAVQSSWCQSLAPNLNLLSTSFQTRTKVQKSRKFHTYLVLDWPPSWGILTTIKRKMCSFIANKVISGTQKPGGEKPGVGVRENVWLFAPVFCVAPYRLREGGLPR